MDWWKVTPSASKADLTIVPSRMSWKGRTFDSRRVLTFSRIHFRVAWDIDGLLAVPGIGSCNHQSLSARRSSFLYPFLQNRLTKSECHSALTPITAGPTPGGTGCRLRRG